MKDKNRKAMYARENKTRDIFGKVHYYGHGFSDKNTGIITYPYHKKVISDQTKETLRKGGYPANILEANHARNLHPDSYKLSPIDIRLSDFRRNLAT